MRTVSSSGVTSEVEDLDGTFSGGSGECHRKLLWKEQHGPPLQLSAATLLAPVLADWENAGKEGGEMQTKTSLLKSLPSVFKKMSILCWFF